MRFMILIKSDPKTEMGGPPSVELLTAMGKFNQELVDAGVLLAAEGLKDSSTGARVKTTGGKQTVTDGPFAEAKELIAGFWMIRAESLEEAVGWAKRVPTTPEVDTALEVRQVIEAEDFGDNLTPELKADEERLRARVAEQQ